VAHTAKFRHPILDEIGELAVFTRRFFKEIFKPRQEHGEFLRQCYWVGYKSFPLVAITAFIMGLVLTIQSRPTMMEFGAQSLIPKMVSISLVREIVPVITALICAGKVGSGMGAELGSMRVTEQIDAMEVSGTNPFKYLIVTRVMAITLMLPVLTSLAFAVSMYGGYLGINIHDPLSWNLYWAQVYEALAYGDIVPAMTKTIFFGFAIGIIGCFKGYYSKKGTEGVGRSANSAVVAASLMVFVIDLIAVQITSILGLN
jgi:phospholipid/cholesterol/gamma-HCH transport system permease protein